MPEKLDSFVYLPQDLVIEIILRLPAKSVGRFRCVSTGWLSISTDPSFILSHARRIPKSLAFHFIPRKVHRRKILDAFPPPQNERFTVHIGKRKFNHIAYEPAGSCDGLVCFREKPFGGPLKYVLNPLTGLRIDIPSHSVNTFGVHTWGYELYYHRWTGQYRVLHAHGYISGDRVCAEVLTLGGGAMNSWRQIHATIYPAVTVVQSRSVLANDCFYWICRKVIQDNVLLVFDISEEAFSCMEFPPDVLLCDRDYGLISIEGKLGCWMVSRDENLIDNYRINIWVAVGGGEKWRSTYSLCLADEWRRPIYASPFYAEIEFGLFSKGLILFLVRGRGIPYLLCWDLKSANHYYTTQLTDVAYLTLDPTLMNGETLIDMATLSYARTDSH